ncbi:hypothetical protein ACN6J9_06570 [Carnobacterium maltaromaticum]|uniref:hypothetical protein n=1 Tax=Carnobacterium maltaromaticum TaxID=2751 RepID=UPI0009CB63ED|nr:hypothetical protein BN1423_1070016 [Carnobacterium maltaromaticum]
MKFLTEGNRTIKADAKYEDIYQQLNEKTGMGIAEIFYLCVLIGFKNQRKSEGFITGRKEFRVTYLDETQRSVLYAIANEQTPLVDLNTAEKIKQTISEYQKYSNGGMEILIEEVFKNNCIKGHLNESYKDYDVDMICYVYDQLNEMPF